ncbi:DUF4334 domain-containing protein [Terriglobus saanensis]|uniref:DUF4334 domain-containing protein n=1 Tax=Terriglobus saanensis TaxID=870903 RepID=UPI001C9DCC26|nr:DUF4334 domain-containing protein [Terriglobus saanensis]
MSDLFDSLESVSCEDVFAKWQGGGFDTGHWLLPALAGMKWYGKWIKSTTDAKPLVCYNDDGQLYSNQAMNGEASVAMMEFRGKVSATVVYDGVPMRGHLRKVDHNTLLGAVSGKSLPTGDAIVQDGRHQYFYLERVEEFPARFIEE